MSDASKAVFLSYASQDVEAAKNICEALRAAGIEVWFDRSELRGGDAWDGKIRRQIKECALFVPVISAGTQTRLEGYFRLEWRLADQRTHLMGRNKAFLMPVCIDTTPDTEADVPDSFTTVQWTRLFGGETPPAFAQRVKKLLAGDHDVGRGRRTPLDSEAAASGEAARQPRRGRWLGLAIIGVVICAAVAFWQPWRKNEQPSVAAAPTVGPTPSGELARVRARIIPDRWQQEDFAAVSATLDRLIQTNAEESDAWALRSIINSLQVLRNFDAGTKPLEVGKTAADRALRLAPGSPLAEIATGMHLVAMTSRGGDAQACRPHIERGVAALPPDALTRYAELVSYWFAFDFDNVQRCANAWLDAEPRASFPAWVYAQSYVVRRQPVEAEKWAEVAAADPNITGVRALYTMFESKYYLRANLRAGWEVLQRVPLAGRSVHRVVHARWLLAVAEQRWDEALQELAQVPETFLLDRSYHGPKALLAGLAHQRAGRADAAIAQFREAERLLKEQLATDSDDEELHAVLAVTLACAGRGAEARSELALVEPLVKGRPPSLYCGTLVMPIAQAYAALGDFSNLAYWLRKLLTEPSQFPFTPASIRVDPRFAGAADSPEIQALLKEFASLDQPAALTSSGPPPVDQKSDAVLAFANLSDDKGNEYFSDGISEELIDVLTKVPGLKVSARTSALHFKGKDTSIAEIARQLGVAYVVEGSVRKAGERVRITAQLIKAADGFHVWSDTFTRDLKDIFAVQDEIACLVAKNLSLKLGTAPAARVVNPEAYRLFLQGRAIFNREVPDDYAKAIECYRASLEIDGDSALTWAWLSMAYYMSAGSGTHTIDAGYKLARETALRAIALDPGLAKGHGALALVHLSHDRDWIRARSSLERTAALAPGDAETVSFQALLALIIGQTDQAVLLGRKAVELDPMNYFSGYALIRSLFSQKDFAEMEKQIERLVALNPSVFRLRLFLTFGRLFQDRIDAAAEALEQVPVTVEWARLTGLACLRFAQGRIAESEDVLNELEQKHARQSAYQIAEVHAFRREPDEAFAWLETSYSQRDSGTVLLKCDPLLENLHHDARWLPLLRKMNLADDQLA